MASLNCPFAHVPVLDSITFASHHLKLISVHQQTTLPLRKAQTEKEIAAHKMV